MNSFNLSTVDVLLAASLLAINGGISIWFRLGLGRDLFVAAVRMVVQLSLVGLALKTLFISVSPWFTALAAIIMVCFGGYEAMARQRRRLAGMWGYGIGTGVMLTAAATVTIFALATQIQADPWYHPRFAIPLLGMILGNCMNGVALGLNELLGRLSRERAAIDAMLALGYDKREAMAPLTRDAIRTGLIPIINAMAATGLVALPGMMTGQILAGVDPTEAVKYQMLVMFLIGGGTALGVLLAVLIAARRVTDDRHRLRLDRLSPD
jgi:putative ABC transport system permease protein